MAGVAELVDQIDSIADDDIVYRRYGWSLAGNVSSIVVGIDCPLVANHFGDFSKAMAEAKGYPRPCMSVGLRSVLIDHGFGPEKLLEDWPAYGIASIQVGDLRKLERKNGEVCHQGVMLCPEVNEPWHAVVFDLLANQRSDAAKRSILALAQIEIPLTRGIGSI